MIKRIPFTYSLLILFNVLLVLNTNAHNTKRDSVSLNTSGKLKNEIGIAISPAYFINEGVSTFAMHIHYTRSIPNSKFGVGASFERIVLNPKHSTFGLNVSYNPINHLKFVLSPGVTFEDGDSTALFALHFEATYGFEFGNMHLGPAFELASDPNDFHISLGVHIGFKF